MQISCLSLLHTMCHSNVMEQDNSIKTEKSMVISYSSPRYPLHSAQCLDKKRMGADTANGNVSLLQIWLSACTAEKNKTLSIKFEDAASRNPTKMTKILSECMTWLAHCYSQPTFIWGGNIVYHVKVMDDLQNFFFVQVVHLLKSPAVSLGCCWTCLPQYSKSVVNQ